MGILLEFYGNFMEFLWNFYGIFYGNFIEQMIQVIVLPMAMQLGLVLEMFPMVEPSSNVLIKRQTYVPSMEQQMPITILPPIS